MFNLNYLLACF